VSSEPLDLRIVSAGATAEDIAAVTAVLHAALNELTAQLDAEARPTVSAWQRSQRALRAPLRPGAGAWRGFSA
jgi:gamma-glutamyl:cysteine ligase YbdK (ATP-grasp superfamily)